MISFWQRESSRSRTLLKPTWNYSEQISSYVTGVSVRIKSSVVIAERAAQVTAEITVISDIQENIVGVDVRVVWRLLP